MPHVPHDFPRRNSAAARSAQVLRWVASALATLAPFRAAAQTDDISKSDNWPCDTCHPTGLVASDDFGAEGPPHEISLEGHDRLGKGTHACLMCHSSDAKPERLLALDGRTVAIDGDVAGTCERCHFDKVREWRASFHGKGKKCTNAHCHSPHSPATLKISLAPFGPDSTTLYVGKRRRPIQALPAVAGGPPLQETPGAARVAAGGVIIFAGLAALALAAITRKRGES